MIKASMNVEELESQLSSMQTGARRQQIRALVSSQNFDLEKLAGMREPFKMEFSRAITGYAGWGWEELGIPFYMKPAEDPIKFPPKEQISHIDLPDYIDKNHRVQKNKLFDRPISVTSPRAQLLKDIYQERVVFIDAEEWGEYQMSKKKKENADKAPSTRKTKADKKEKEAEGKKAE